MNHCGGRLHYQCIQTADCYLENQEVITLFSILFTSSKPENFLESSSSCVTDRDATTSTVKGRVIPKLFYNGDTMCKDPNISRDWFVGQVRVTQGPVRAFIRRLGVRPESVDDIAQEAYVTAFLKHDEFIPGANFCSWICQIARRHVANERRTEVRRRQILSEQVTDLLLAQQSEVFAPIDENVHQETLTTLGECVAKLPEHSRALLHERYHEDLRPGVIASQLGLSSNQIRQRLLRIRRTLLACLEQHGGLAASTK